MSFDKAAFLAAAQQIPTEAVTLPELGGITIHLRAMTGRERDAWEKSLLVGRGKRREVDTTNVRAKLVALTACDASGERVFSDADAEELGKARVDVLNKLFTVAQKLSGVSDEDVDELGKGSAPAAGSASPTS